MVLHQGLIYVLLKMLTTSDLYTDAVLIRKIKRLQAAQAADGDDDLDDSIGARQRQTPRGTQRRGGLEVGSDDEDIDTRISSAPRIKSERAVSRSFTIGADAENADEEAEEEDETARPTPSQGGVIVDMGEETEEDEEEE